MVLLSDWFQQKSNSKKMEIPLWQYNALKKPDLNYKSSG